MTRLLSTLAVAAMTILLVSCGADDEPVAETTSSEASIESIEDLIEVYEEATGASCSKADAGTYDSIADLATCAVGNYGSGGGPDQLWFVHEEDPTRAAPLSVRLALTVDEWYANLGGVVGVVVRADNERLRIVTADMERAAAVFDVLPDVDPCVVAPLELQREFCTDGNNGGLPE